MSREHNKNYMLDILHYMLRTYIDVEELWAYSLKLSQQYQKKSIKNKNSAYFYNSTIFSDCFHVACFKYALTKAAFNK